MTRARDAFGTFLPRTPSLLEDGNRYQEGQREDCDTDFQTIFGEFDNQYGTKASVFINPIAPLENQVVQRGIDQEDPQAERVMAEDE